MVSSTPHLQRIRGLQVQKTLMRVQEHSCQRTPFLPLPSPPTNEFIQKSKRNFSETKSICNMEKGPDPELHCN